MRLDMFALGCHKDPIDLRDIPMGLVLPPVPLPKTVDYTLKMSPVRNQGDEGTCHSADTEILTRNGWKLFSRVNNEDELATINQNNLKLEYQKPSKLHVCDFNGKLYYSSNIHLDFALTPDHRMFVRKFDNTRRFLSSNFEFVKIKDLGWYVGLLGSPKGFEGEYVKNIKIGNDKEVNGDDFLKFLGIFLSDGWLRTRRTPRYGYCIGTCCFKKKYYNTIYNLLKTLPFDFREQPGRRGYFITYDKDLYNFLKSYSIEGASEKYIPDFVKNASTPQIQMFLDFFRLGDGHKTRNGRIWYYTSSKRMADDLQELILKTGKHSSVITRFPRNNITIEGRKIKTENCHNEFVVSVWRTAQLSIDRKKQIYTRVYKGKVYCATVPNSILVTRRNGKVLISGNCVAFASVVGVKEYQDKREYNRLILLSPRYLYYFCKRFDGQPDQEGTYPRIAMKVLAKYGVAEESCWPYKPFQKDPPCAIASRQAKRYRIKAYGRLGSIAEMRRSLAINGPFLAGVKVFKCWFSKEVLKSGLIPMPKKNEETIGGHALCIIGFDDTKQIFKFKNSWGRGWADKGYGYLSYSYLQKYCVDAWSATDLILDPRALVKKREEAIKRFG